MSHPSSSMPNSGELPPNAPPGYDLALKPLKFKPSSADCDATDMLNDTVPLPGGTSAMLAILPASDAASLSSALSPLCP